MTHNNQPIITIEKRPLSRLTYKILSLNLIVVAVIGMSFSYIAQTRENLIAKELNAFANEASLFAKALTMVKGQKTPQSLKKTLSYLNLKEDQKAWLFDENGNVIAETGTLPLRKLFADSLDTDKAPIERSILSFFDRLSVNFNLPPFPESQNLNSIKNPMAEETIDDLSMAAWSAPDGGLVISAVMTIHSDNGKDIVLQLARRNIDLEYLFSSIRIDVVRFVFIALLLTISFSLYLSATIGHPLRALASSAELFRRQKGRGVQIPDMSDRHDEIGELSLAIRDMTDALRTRLSAIESFAADVSHELKNPLTSLRSAIETLPKVQKEDDRRRLIDIIHHDLRRMDRLITDISMASRLDAELSRDIFETIDICEVIKPVIESHRVLNINHTLITEGLDNPLIIKGQGGRLAQVFDNVIANALSFTPPDKKVTIKALSVFNDIIVTIDDEGPGIPEGQHDKIFERFYSERPESESFGLHSGLGLSIARQIMESHHGSIKAENRYDENGSVIGARFIILFKKDGVS